MDLLEYNKCRTDPIYFIEKYMTIKNTTHGRVNFVLNSEQKRIIQDAYNAYIASSNVDVYKISIRQIGKSSCVLAFLIWYTRFNDNVTIDIRSYKLDMTKELLRMVDDLIVNMDNNFYIHQSPSTVVGREGYRFVNGSSIIGSPINSELIEGTDIVYVDEYDFIDKQTYYKDFENELYEFRKTHKVRTLQVSSKSD